MIVAVESEGREPKLMFPNWIVPPDPETRQPFSMVARTGNGQPEGEELRVQLLAAQLVKGISKIMLQKKHLKNIMLIAKQD